MSRDTHGWLCLLFYFYPEKWLYNNHCRVGFISIAQGKGKLVNFSWFLNCGLISAGLTIIWGWCHIDTGSVSDLGMRTESGPRHLPFLAALSGMATRGRPSLIVLLCAVVMLKILIKKKKSSEKLHVNVNCEVSRILYSVHSLNTVVSPPSHRDLSVYASNSICGVRTHVGTQ